MGQYIAIQRRMCHSENAHLPERRFSSSLQSRLLFSSGVSRRKVAQAASSHERMINSNTWKKRARLRRTAGVEKSGVSVLAGHTRVPIPLTDSTALNRLSTSMVLRMVLTET